MPVRVIVPLFTRRRRKFLASLQSHKECRTSFICLFALVGVLLLALQVDDLAVASAAELFKGRYPHLLSLYGTTDKQSTTSPVAASDAAGTVDSTVAAAAAAEACARNQLLIDLEDEPWKSASRHAGLFLNYEDFKKA